MSELALNLLKPDKKIFRLASNFADIVSSSSNGQFQNKVREREKTYILLIYSIISYSELDKCSASGARPVPLSSNDQFEEQPICHVNIYIH